MRLVDTHTHAWGRETLELPWVADVLPPGWSGPYTHRDLIADMDRIGIDEAVVVTTPLYGRGPRANEYTMRAIEAHPDRLYGVAVMEYFDGTKSVLTQLQQVTGHDRMLGVRMHASLAYDPIPTEVDRQATWISSAELDPVWEELGELETAVFVFPKADQLTRLEQLAAKHPRIQFVVDHLAWPDETTSPDESPWTDFEAVAEHDNVLVKVSSIPRSAATPWPYEDMHVYLQRLLDWFGAERLMIGSDYPWMDDWASYRDCLDWIETVPGLSRRDRAFLQYRTFDRTVG